MFPLENSENKNTKLSTIEHPGQSITSEDLAVRPWPNTIFSNVLTKIVFDISSGYDLFMGPTN